VNRWDPSTWRNAGPKKPPPDHGIKVKKAGTTWWGQRWIAALEELLLGDSGRLSRGRSYARAGRVHDLTVREGAVSAKVTGSREEPYRVTMELRQLKDDEWRRAIAGMAAKAQFAAELLAGEMPKDIDGLFREAGTSLFPRLREELATKCSCPDWGDPCKHVAATHYVLGEAFDRDPFLLFELRGRTKAEVLDQLRAARGVQGASDEPAPSVRTVTLRNVEAASYDRAPEALPALHFSFDAPTTHAAVLKQLGAPTAWNESSSPAEALAPLVQRAADRARRIAMAEPETPPASAPPPPERPKKRPRRGRMKG
jgi:uncharacterized Zn finger protein